jgi:hypothetical protein
MASHPLHERIQSTAHTLKEEKKRAAVTTSQNQFKGISRRF